MHHETRIPHPRARHVKGAQKPQRPPAWRPHQVGLSREELRRIVLDQLG
ncbi:hypothetical protein [Enterovirga sp.]|nr:hypothetical protein [Enterovirga sp.]HMO29015.1 hypothetical protein [Enterovirga sp.]